MVFAKGTTFAWNGHVIAKLNNIGTPELSIETQDTTTHSNTERFREFAAALIDAGEVPVSGFMDEMDTAGQMAMYADAAAGVMRTVVITGPNAAYSMTFEALITKIKPIGDQPIDGHVTFSASVKVSGVPVLTVSKSAGMSGVTVSNSGAIAPGFSTDVYDYIVNFATSVTSCTFTPTAANHTIAMLANGINQAVTSGAASAAVNLGSAGSVTIVDIAVTEKGKAAKTYRFRCVRAAA